jgi:Flp pilus assembly protein TadG
MAIATVDYGRVMSSAIALEEGARNGAVYLSQAKVRSAVPYASVQDFVRAGITGLSPAPTVTSSTTTDANGRSIVTVTVAATFTTYGRYPGIPGTVSLSRSSSMYVGPD